MFAFVVLRVVVVVVVVGTAVFEELAIGRDDRGVDLMGSGIIDGC